MKNKPHYFKSSWGLVGAAFMVCVLSSCVTTQPYIHQNIPNPVNLTKSDAHSFRYVNVTNEKDGELTVYGKIGHSHLTCSSEGHVDVAILSENAKPIFTTSIPIVKRSSRQRGWYGAAFRAKLPVTVSKKQTVHIAFHDDNCVTEQTFDCDNNVAIGEKHDKGTNIRDE